MIYGEEELDHDKRKVAEILAGKNPNGPWVGVWSAKELEPILQRLADAEFERDFLLESIKANGDGFGWEPRDWDYRCHPGEVVRWALSSRKASAQSANQGGEQR